LQDASQSALDQQSPEESNHKGSRKKLFTWMADKESFEFCNHIWATQTMVWNVTACIVTNTTSKSVIEISQHESNMDYFESPRVVKVIEWFLSVLELKCQWQL
jgi:hypothetical protein